MRIAKSLIKYVLLTSGWTAAFFFTICSLVLCLSHVHIPYNFHLINNQKSLDDSNIKKGGVSVVFRLKQYQEKDFLCYKSEEKQIQIGRLKEIEEPSKASKKYIVNNGIDSERISIENNKIVGRVVYNIPFAGKLLVWSRTTDGIAVLIAIPLILIATLEFSSIKNIFRKKSLGFVEDPNIPNNRVSGKGVVRSPKNPISFVIHKIRDYGTISRVDSVGRKNHIVDLKSINNNKNNDRVPKY
jgi:hypothetical protein